MSLDTGTVFAAFTCVFAVNSVVLFYYWRLHRDRFPETLDFFTATVLFTVSFLLFAFTNHLDRFLANTVSHALLLLAIVFLYRGFGKFLRKPFGGRLNYVIAALAVAVFWLFGTLKPDLSALGLSYALFTGIIVFRLTLLVLVQYRENDLPKLMVLGSTVIYLLSISGMVPIYNTFQGENLLVFDNRVAFTLCLIMSAAVMATLGIVLMISKELLLQERKISEHRTLLVKEMHHRTKNNLGIVNALLLLQSKGMEDELCREALEDSLSRITSMAAIYDFVSEADDQESIDLQNYVSRFVERIMEGMEKPDVKIRQNLEVPGLLVSMDYAVPIGLLVNEFVTNSIKHAFTGNSDSEISITFREIGESEYELSYRDNGVGLPENFDFLEAKSLGMTIIKSLTSQLSGDLTVKSEEGTFISVRFRTPAPLVAAA